jgi:hypothetical protein
MTPLILSISTFTVLAAAFLLSRVWLSRQPDSLRARQQALGYLIGITVAAMIALAISAYSIPSFTMPRPLGVGFTLMLLYAIWHHRLLSQQIQRRRTP